MDDQETAAASEHEKPKAYIKEVSRSGVVTINFTKKMKSYLFGQTDKKRRELQQGESLQILKDESMIQVEMIDGSQTDEFLNKEFDWSIKDYTSTRMKIQLKFEQPNHVS